MREPCMTIKELAQRTGVSEPALIKRSQKKPLPPEVVFESKFTAPLRIGYKSRQFKRSELLHWFENSTIYKKDK